MASRPQLVVFSPETVSLSVYFFSIFRQGTSKYPLPPFFSDLYVTRLQMSYFLSLRSGVPLGRRPLLPTPRGRMPVYPGLLIRCAFDVPSIIQLGAGARPSSNPISTLCITPACSWFFCFFIFLPFFLIRCSFGLSLGPAVGVFRLPRLNTNLFPCSSSPQLKSRRLQSPHHASTCFFFFFMEVEGSPSIRAFLPLWSVFLSSPTFSLRRWTSAGRAHGFFPWHLLFSL